MSLFLQNSDFMYDEKTGLTIPINKFSLVLFWSNNCKFCITAKTIVSSLMNSVGNCTFALCNLDTNRQVIEKCIKSGIELDRVPFFVFFINRKPHMVYSGPMERKNLERFIVEVSNQYIEDSRGKNENGFTSLSNKEYRDEKTINNSCKIGDKECQQKNPHVLSNSYCTLEMAYKKK